MARLVRVCAASNAATTGFVSGELKIEWRFESLLVLEPANTAKPKMASAINAYPAFDGFNLDLLEDVVKNSGFSTWQTFMVCLQVD
jgi:hypothetical protein